MTDILPGLHEITGSTLSLEVLEGLHVNHGTPGTGRSILEGLELGGCILGMDDLDLRHDVVLGAEFQHLLGFGNASNQGSLQLVVVEDKSHGGHTNWLWYGANADISTVDLESSH